jgi:hypothetical protein
MRADFHGGPEHSTLQSKAGYIDARPQSRQTDKNLLQRTAGPYIWVKGSLCYLRKVMPVPGPGIEDAPRQGIFALEAMLQR